MTLLSQLLLPLKGRVCPSSDTDEACSLDKELVMHHEDGGLVAIAWMDSADGDDGDCFHAAFEEEEEDTSETGDDGRETFVGGDF